VITAPNSCDLSVIDGQTDARYTVASPRGKTVKIGRQDIADIIRIADILC